jgi:hypothetical protein
LAPDGNVVLKDEYMGLSAYSARGTLRWEQRLGMYANCAPFGDVHVADDGTIFAEAAEHGVFGLAPSGKRLWRDLNSSVASSACGGNVLYVVHRDPPRWSNETPVRFSLKAIDTRGRLLWERPLPGGEDWPGLQADPAGHILFVQTNHIILFGSRGQVIYKAFAGPAPEGNGDNDLDPWLLPNGVVLLPTVEGTFASPSYMLRAIAPDGRVIKQKAGWWSWGGLEINGNYGALPSDKGYEVFRIRYR